MRDQDEDVCRRCASAITRSPVDGAWEDESGACGCGDGEHEPSPDEVRRLRDSADERHARIKRAVRRVYVEKLVPVQRQDSLTDQLTDIWMLAARLGMYDAADWLWKNAKLEQEKHDQGETRWEHVTSRRS